MPDSAGGFTRTRHRVRLFVWGGLAALLVAMALWPYAFVFRHFAVRAVLGAAAVAWLARRRIDDVLWLAVPAAAVAWVEPGTATRIAVLIALPCFVLTLRPRFAAALALAFMALLLAGIHFKLRFAGSRLTWQDLYFFFTEFHDNVKVFETQPTLLLYSAGVLAALAALLGGCWVWDGRRASASAQRRPSRGAAAVLAAVVVAVSGNAVADEVARVRSLGPWSNGTLAQISAFPFAGFLHSATIRTEWVEPLVDTGRFAADVHAEVRDARARSRPRPADIVMFLQESQFNPATVEACPPDICTMPVFGADAATRAYGSLRVHTFGGGTWLSEFAVATGVPHTVFGEGGGYASFTVAPGLDHSAVQSLRDAGYRTVAVFPIAGGMMNRRNAYKAYGYDAIYEPQDLGMPGGFHTTDQAMHEAALRVLERERRHGKPVLLMAITIFNHCEHGVELERVPPALLARARALLPDRHAADVLADFVWRTGEFQAAMRRTERALLGGPQPVVLAWFGDHQPPNAAELPLLSADPSGRIPARMQAWYHVSSNVPGAPRARAAAPLDIVFLTGLLAQTAGAPLDEYLAANVTAREQCGGLLRECTRPEVRDSYLSYLRRDLDTFDLP